MFNATLPAYCHVYNPVWLVMSNVASATYTYTVYDENNNSVFAGTGTGATVSVDLSDVVRSLITDLNAASFIASTTISSNLLSFLAPFSVVISDGTNTTTLSSKAVPGGIPLRLFRLIANATSDAFKSIFFNGSINFLMSTRTRNQEIFIKETELVPVAFFGYFTNMTIQTGSTVITSIIGEGSTITKAIAVNLDAVRKYYFSTTGILLNRFDFYTDTDYCFSINIIESKEFRGYSFLFKNSLGVFEKMEIEGEFSYQPDLSYDAAFKQYDPVTGGLISARDKIVYIEKLTAEIGFTTPDWRIWANDLLISEEVYLCIDSQIYACLVTADKISLQRSKVVPENLLINIEMVDSENLFSPYLTANSASNNKRIFDNTFDGTFN